MKKSLIALAVATALPATAMAASQVRMYGIADAFVGFQDDDRAGGDGGLVVNSGGQSTSRWGVDGSEDLGGGLSAVFKFEAALSVDDGTAGGVAFRRRSYVGLKGGFGEVVLGRTFTPIFWTTIENDVGGMAHSITDFSTLGGGAAGRWDNGIHYSGKFGGLKLYAAYAPDETAADEDGLGIGVRYSGGSFGASVGYQTQPISGDTHLQVGANVSLGAFELGANWVNIEDNATGLDGDNIGVSAQVKFGSSSSLLLNVVDFEAGDTDMQLFYRQGISKRTNWYAGYLDFDTGGTEFRVGVRHRF
jgi:predicted porin